MNQTLIPVESLIIALSAGIGAIIAISGLSTWKKQISISAEYKVAINLLKSTYKLRDAIAWVRNPFVSAAEMVNKTNVNNQNLVKDNEGIIYAYQNRWQGVVSANTEISTSLLEAEVLWGPQIKGKYDELAKSIGELYSTIQIYFTSLKEPEGKLFTEKYFDILYSTNDNKDIYKNKLEERIQDIEKLLKPHLNRKN